MSEELGSMTEPTENRGLQTMCGHVMLHGPVYTNYTGDSMIHVPVVSASLLFSTQ